MPELTPAQLLNLIPYFSKFRSMMEAAVDLDIPFVAVRDGLEQLAELSQPGLTAYPAFRVEFGDNWTARITPKSGGLAAPMRLTAAEAATLLLTLESLESSADLNNRSVVQSAAAKLRAAVADHGAVYDSTPDTVRSGTWGAVISQALRERRVLKMTYRKSNDEVSERLIEPVALMTVEDISYLRAVDKQDPTETVKSFRLDRIMAAEVLEDKATSRRDGEIDPLDPHGFGKEQCPEKWALVEVDADATWISDYDPVFWEEDAGESDTGTYRAYVPMGDIEATISFILRRSPSVRVLEPVSLQNAVHDRALSGLAEYGVAKE